MNDASVKGMLEPRPGALFKSLATLCFGYIALSATPAAHAQSDGGALKMIPWTNDFSYLADPAKRTGEPWERLAYIGIGSNPRTYLSIGGQIRYAYNYWDSTKLGLAGANDGNHNIEQRLRLHADLHVTDAFRAFLELGDNREYGARVASTPNNDRMDLIEGFVDWRIKLPEQKGSFTLRVGRFYMPLGSGKLVGVREAPNMRFSYDGVRGFYTAADGTRLDLFYVNPVLISDDANFDDKPNHATRFSGAYFTHPLASLNGSALDFYFYDVARTSVRYASVSGREERYTYGSRLSGKRFGWDYDAEVALQNGTIGEQDIRAWAVLSEAGFTFSQARFSPRLGVRVNAFSGDRHPNDGTLETFAAPAPKLPLFSDAGWVNYMNLVDVYPQVTLHLPEHVDLMAGLDFMWRQTTADGIYYGPSAAPLTAGGEGGRYIGTSGNLQADWQVNRLLNVHLAYTHLKAGSAVTDLGGNSGNYLLSWVDFKF